MSFVYPLLLAAALVLIQFLIGGTQFAYSFPSHAIIGLTAVLSLFSIGKRGFKVSNLCLITATLLVAYVLGRAWYSPNPYLARADAFQAVACFAVYLLTSFYITQSRYRLWVIGALLAVAAVHVAIGAFQFKTGDNWYLSHFGFYFFDKPSYRAGGLMISGNHFAGFLETVALFALSLTIWSRCRVSVKLLTGYLVLLCYVGIVMSGSRGGYLSSAFSLMVFAVLTLWMVRIVNRQRFMVASIATALLLAIFIGGAWMTMGRSPVIKERMNRLANATEDVRRYNWLAALDQFHQSPAIGTGSGTHLYYGRLFRRPQIQNDPEHAHGDYVEFLAEYGIAGSVLAVVFLLTHLGAGLRAARDLAYRRLCNSYGPPRSDTLALTLASLAAVAALLSHSVVDFNMHIPGNALLLAFVFGMLASPALDREEGMAVLPMILRGVLVLAGAALIAAVALKYPNERYSNQARLALRSNQFAEATELAQKAIEADPKNPEPYFYLGEAARICARNMPNFALAEPYYEKAVSAYREGLKYFPQDENFWVRLGQSLDGLTRFEEADEAYREAIAWDPSLGIIYAYYAGHFRLLSDEESAKACEAAARSLGAADFHEIAAGERPSIPEFYREQAPKSPQE